MFLCDAILVMRLFAVFRLVQLAAAAVSDEKLSLVCRQPDSEEVQRLIYTEKRKKNLCCSSKHATVLLFNLHC